MGGGVTIPPKEVIEENEEKLFIVGGIDRTGLKQLTAALKDLKDIRIATESVANENNSDYVKKVGFCS